MLLGSAWHAGNGTPVLLAAFVLALSLFLVGSVLADRDDPDDDLAEEDPPDPPEPTSPDA